MTRDLASPGATTISVTAFSHTAASWQMKRPRRHRNLELGPTYPGVAVSTKLIPNDGREHDIMIAVTNGVLEVRLDGAVIERRALA